MARGALICWRSLRSRGAGAAASGCAVATVGPPRYCRVVLEELRITGLGVIVDTTLPLAGGMNVITGETGAGKTMVVTGLGLLFGGRADAARVRADPGRAG